MTVPCFVLVGGILFLCVVCSCVCVCVCFFLTRLLWYVGRSGRGDWAGVVERKVERDFSLAAARNRRGVCHMRRVVVDVFLFPFACAPAEARARSIFVEFFFSCAAKVEVPVSRDLLAHQMIASRLK